MPLSNKQNLVWNKKNRVLSVPSGLKGLTFLWKNDTGKNHHEVNHARQSTNPRVSVGMTRNGKGGNVLIDTEPPCPTLVNSRGSDWMNIKIRMKNYWFDASAKLNHRREEARSNRLTFYVTFSLPTNEFIIVERRLNGSLLVDGFQSF